VFISQTLFSQLTVWAGEYQVYSFVSRGLWNFFFISCGLQSGALHFLFLYFIERHRWRSVFPWPSFVDQALLSHSIFFSMMCTSIAGGIMINRRKL